LGSPGIGYGRQTGFEPLDQRCQLGQNAQCRMLDGGRRAGAGARRRDAVGSDGAGGRRLGRAGAPGRAVGAAKVRGQEEGGLFADPRAHLPKRKSINKII